MVCTMIAYVLYVKQMFPVANLTLWCKAGTNYLLNLMTDAIHI